MNVVVIAAAQFELDPLVQSLQQLGLSATAEVLGVGAIKAAQNSRPIAQRCRGKDVIFIGTCGSFTAFEGVQLVRADRCIWAPTAERMGLAYGVKNTNPPIELPSPPDWALDLPARAVVCGPSISLVNRVPEGLPAGDAVENLELYSAAQPIISQCRSFCAVLGVTNQVGGDAHSQWKQHFTTAAGKTAEFVSSRIKPAP